MIKHIENQYEPEGRVMKSDETVLCFEAYALYCFLLKQKKNPNKMHQLGILLSKIRTHIRSVLCMNGWLMMQKGQDDIALSYYNQAYFCSEDPLFHEDTFNIPYIVTMMVVCRGRLDPSRQKNCLSERTQEFWNVCREEKIYSFRSLLSRFFPGMKGEVCTEEKNSKVIIVPHGTSIEDTALCYILDHIPVKFPYKVEYLSTGMQGEKNYCMTFSSGTFSPACRCNGRIQGKIVEPIVLSTFNLFYHPYVHKCLRYGIYPVYLAFDTASIRESYKGLYGLSSIFIDQFIGSLQKVVGTEMHVLGIGIDKHYGYVDLLCMDVHRVLHEAYQLYQNMGLHIEIWFCSSISDVIADKNRSWGRSISVRKLSDNEELENR